MGEGKKQTLKSMEVVIFNQKHNPQTSVGKVLTTIKREGISLKEIFSVKGLAVLAFLAMVLMFIVNSRLCPEDQDFYTKKDERLNDGGRELEIDETWVD